MVWQYLLTTSLDGKQPGWHPYTQEASKKLTSHHLQSIHNNRERTTYRIKSGYYTYEVNTVAMTQRNISTGTVRQIRQSDNFADSSPNKRQKLSTDTVALEPLFGGLHGHLWEDVLSEKLKSSLQVEEYLGVHRHSCIVPVRELTFQALKPIPPVAWRVIVLGQNPYPRFESATGIAMFDAAFDDWNHKKFGTTTSIRNIIKAAAMAVHSIPKETTAKDLRKLLDDKNVVSPPQWFQAMLAQGVLLLNTALTTGGDMDPSVYASFWRPIIETIIETILQAKSKSTEKDADTRKGIVFLWWGCIAMKTKRKMNTILRKYENEVDIRHLEWWNPAAQGDKFCNDPKHFVEVNKCITSMGMKPINWLPNHSWFTNPNSILSGMGDFITDTRKLHSMYMERLSSGLECEQNLPPITGIRSTDLKGFVDACAPIGLASEALHILETVKTMENKALTDDEKGALYLYTGHCIYARLNKILRSPNRANLRSCYSYLLLFLHAYDKLKKRCENQTLYRGIDKDLTISYGTRSKVIWWSISSCSSDRDIAEGFANCGTLFHVRTTTAVPIMDYSACGDEDEYILAPSTQLKVMKVVRRGKGLSEIFLEEMKASELVT